MAGSTLGAGGGDFWVLRLNPEGTLAWQRTYGGADDDWAFSLQQTSDGGFIVAGYTESFGAGGGDFWVLKLNPDGTLAWQRTYGGASHDYAHSLQQTSDGGFIVAGMTSSFGAGSGDFWVLKLDGDGNITPAAGSGFEVHDTSATVSDTFVTPVDTSATVLSTSATVTDTSATVQDTDCIIQQQAP